MYVDDLGLEVDVAPAQAEDFTTAQAIEHEQNERGMQLIGIRDGQETSCLVSSPGPHGSRSRFWEFDQPGDIAND